MDHPSFTFRLERVKSLREQAKDSAREQLARQLALRMRGEALLRQAAATAEAARDSGRGTLSRPGASGADLAAAQRWIERTDGSRREAALDLDRRDAEVSARRDALVVAMREHEVIGRLEARQRAAHDREMARREQNQLDEMALNIHRRRGVAA